MTFDQSCNVQLRESKNQTRFLSTYVGYVSLSLFFSFFPWFSLSLSLYFLNNSLIPDFFFISPPARVIWFSGIKRKKKIVLTVTSFISRNNIYCHSYTRPSFFKHFFVYKYTCGANEEKLLLGSI